MTKSKKYDYQVIQDNTCWSAKIIRQVTSKKTIVSKRQDGFATESDAEAWGQSEIKAFLQKKMRPLGICLNGFYAVFYLEYTGLFCDAVEKLDVGAGQP